MGTFRSGDKHIIPTYNPLIPKGKREGESLNCEMLTRGSKDVVLEYEFCDSKQFMSSIIYNFMHYPHKLHTSRAVSKYSRVSEKAKNLR